MTIQTTHDLQCVIETEIAKLSDEDRVWWMRFTATAALSMERRRNRVDVAWERYSARIDVVYSTPSGLFTVAIHHNPSDVELTWDVYRTASKAVAGIITLLRTHWLPEVAA